MYKFLPSKFWVIVGMILTLSLVCGGCMGYGNSTFNRLVGITIPAYGELQVTQEWQEIELTNPVKSGVPHRFLVLEIKDGRSWQGFSEREIKSPQGEVINIEAQFIDDQGEAYESHPNFGRPEQIHLWVNYERGKGGEYFPKPVVGDPVKDVVFTRLRIRSNYLFTCMEVHWESREF
jgi:hypothetical protein